MRQEGLDRQRGGAIDHRRFAHGDSTGWVHRCLLWACLQQLWDVPQRKMCRVSQRQADEQELQDEGMCDGARLRNLRGLHGVQ